jgi:Ca2+-binding RTX toxin-like protein
VAGGGGDDRLFGGLSSDQLQGDSGRDTFAYLETADSPAGPDADMILDFTVGVDRIDLSLIDADPLTNGDQAFQWISGSAFVLGQRGGLRLDTTSALGQAWILGEITGDGLADFTIRLTNSVSPLAGDYIL